MLLWKDFPRNCLFSESPFPISSLLFQSLFYCGCVIPLDVHAKISPSPFYRLHLKISLYLMPFLKFLSRATDSFPMLPLKPVICNFLFSPRSCNTFVSVQWGSPVLPEANSICFQRNITILFSPSQGCYICDSIWHRETRIKILRGYGMKGRNSLFLQMERNLLLFS